MGSCACSRRSGFSKATAPQPSTDPDREFEEFFRAHLFDGVKTRLADTADTEERGAEALAWTWREMRRRAERGESTDLALARFIYSRRYHAIDRRLACDGSRRCYDAYDVRAYLAGEVELLRLGGIPDDSDDEDADITMLEASRQMTAEPERTMNSALDLRAWLKSLSAEEHELVTARMTGDTLEEIAQRHRTDVTVMCRRLHRLGHDLAARAEIEIPKSNRGRRPKA